MIIKCRYKTNRLVNKYTFIVEVINARKVNMDEIIRKYYNDLFKWSFAKTKNRFDAEDLTQEITYQIMKAFNNNNLIVEPEKYIWKIAYYTWCNKAKEYIKDKSLIKDTSYLNQIKDSNIDIIKEIEQEEIKEKLNLIIDSFSYKMKTIIKMYYYEDLKVNEISTKLNIKESLVKYYLYEARIKIKDILKEMEITND